MTSKSLKSKRALGLRIDCRPTVPNWSPTPTCLPTAVAAARLEVRCCSCLLVALFDVGLEPFATRVHRFWIWRVAGGGKCLAWFAAPWVNFLGWAVTALLVLMVATPWLINKMPSRRRAADFHPLIVWVTLNVFLAAMLALHQLWLPAGITLAVAVVGTIFARRNAA